MNLDERLQNVAVIGAAGKMGSGIALLLAQEMTLLKLQPENKEKTYRLYLMDVNEAAIEGLLRYVKLQSTKLAEKNIVRLREAYAGRKGLVENHEMIQQFVDDLLVILRTGTDVNLAGEAQMIFEAVIEDADLKISILKKLKKVCSEQCFFFTNTSSIPIQYLDEQAGLDGRIIGYHFYNPPVVQRLVELIAPENVDPALKKQSEELGKRLGKKLIPANDVAGFIGNGHFMRDGLHAFREVEKLKENFSHIQAVYAMNRVSQEFLIRPMGIFQLIDYVGIDVFQLILKTIDPYFPDEDLHSDLIDKMMELEIKGGQNPDGTQKDGFLQYKKSRPVAVFDLPAEQYRPLDEGNWRSEADKKLGHPPAEHTPWKDLLRDPRKSEKLEKYFKSLKKTDNLGSELAVTYLKKSNDIGERLIELGVANSPEDVNGVLLNGFYHLYGPINDYI